MQDLGEAFKLLQTINGVGEKRAGSTIGCLSGTFDSVDIPGIATVSSRRGPIFSCSIAVVENTLAIPFSSALGPDEETQVGRWHSFRKPPNLPSVPSSLDRGNDLPIDWDAIWDEATHRPTPPLPQVLQVPGLSAVLYFTSPRASKLLRSLDTHLSQTTRLGGIAAPTHFSTGRNVTLFHNESILDQGAVGLAFKLPQIQPRPVSLDLGELDPLSDVLPVTASRGNIINSVADLNPSRIVLDAMRQLKSRSPPSLRRVFEEGEVYLAVMGSDGQPQGVYKVTAGDPAARGGMVSLETTRAPDSGVNIQFFYKPPTSTVSLRTRRSTVVELAVVPDTVIEEGDWDRSPVVELPYFVVPLSTGVYHASKGEVSSLCTLPGSSLKL